MVAGLRLDERQALREHGPPEDAGAACDCRNGWRGPLEVYRFIPARRVMSEDYGMDVL